MTSRQFPVPSGVCSHNYLRTPRFYICRAALFPSLFLSPCGVLTYGSYFKDCIQQVEGADPGDSQGFRWLCSCHASADDLHLLSTREGGGSTQPTGGRDRNEKRSKHATLPLLLCSPSAAVLAASASSRRRRVPALNSGKKPRRASLPLPLCTSDAPGLRLLCTTNGSSHRIKHVLIRRATCHEGTSRILVANTCPLHTNESPSTDCPKCPKSPAAGVDAMSC